MPPDLVADLLSVRDLNNTSESPRLGWGKYEKQIKSNLEYKIVLLHKNWYLLL